jgi:hypothetical protein
MAKKKKKVFNVKSWLINSLRRISSRYPPIYTTLNNAKIYKNEGKYKNGKPKIRVYFKCVECEKLKKKKLYTRQEINVDHIEEVIGTEGFVDWNTYIDRLFCEATNLQCLCLEHHKEKTDENNKTRK